MLQNGKKYTGTPHCATFHASLHGDSWTIHSFLWVSQQQVHHWRYKETIPLKKTVWQWCQLRNLSRPTSHRWFADTSWCDIIKPAGNLSFHRPCPSSWGTSARALPVVWAVVHRHGLHGLGVQILFHVYTHTYTHIYIYICPSIQEALLPNKLKGPNFIERCRAHLGIPHSARASPKLFTTKTLLSGGTTSYCALSQKVLKGAAARMLIYWLCSVLAETDDGSLYSKLLGFAKCKCPMKLFSPPARWGLLDFMSVACSSPPLLSSSSSTATLDAQCSLSDLNHDHPRPVFPAGPQPRPSPPSVPCRTSTTTIHAQCSLPGLNREYPRQVFPACRTSCKKIWDKECAEES